MKEPSILDLITHCIVKALTFGFKQTSVGAKNQIKSFANKNKNAVNSL